MRGESLYAALDPADSSTMGVVAGEIVSSKRRPCRLLVVSLQLRSGQRVNHQRAAGLEGSKLDAISEDRV